MDVGIKNKNKGVKRAKGQEENENGHAQKTNLSSHHDLGKIFSKRLGGMIEVHNICP